MPSSMLPNEDEYGEVSRNCRLTLCAKCSKENGSYEESVVVPLLKMLAVIGSCVACQIVTVYASKIIGG